MTLLARLPLAYLASFAAIGASLPFLPLALQEKGVGGGGLAIVLGIFPAGRLLAAPVWSALAEARRAEALALRLAAALAALGIAGVIRADGPWEAGAAVLLLAIGRAPMAPLLDALAMKALGGDGAGYGRLRRWGSLGFLLAVLGSASLVDRGGNAALGVGLALSVALAALLWGLPAPPPAPAAPLLPALREMARSRPLRWLFLASSLHFAAHEANTSFLAVHLQALGESARWAGVAIGVGVAAEIAVLSRSAALLSRFGAPLLFAAPMALAAARWALTAIAPNGPALAALQALHGITFGAFWIAAVPLIAARAPAAVRGSAQGLLAAATGGLGSLLGVAGGSLLGELLSTRHIFLGGAVAAAAALACAWRGLRR